MAGVDIDIYRDTERRSATEGNFDPRAYLRHGKVRGDDVVIDGVQRSGNRDPNDARCCGCVEKTLSHETIVMNKTLRIT